MPLLLDDFTHARTCKPFCEKYLTLPKNRGLLEKSENKNAPGLGKSGSIAFCGYEILECSKHSRCPYTAAK